MNILKKLFTWLESRAIATFNYKLQSLILYFSRGHYTYSNFKMYNEATSLLKLQGLEGAIYEFGVGSGMTASLLSISAENNYQKFPHLYLFDTFEGMPVPQKNDEHFQWVAGNWAFSQKEVLYRLDSFGIGENLVTFFKGDYSMSTRTTSALEALSDKALIVHIDCDYKSSTLTALNYVTPALQNGTVILCDDYFCYSGDPSLGEAGALNEWSDINKIKLRQWKPYSIHGQSFIVFGLD